MGWRGTVRSVNAANNAAIRARGKHARAVDRASASFQRAIDEDAEAVLRRVERCFEKLYRDPIETLSMVYAPGVGFMSESVELGGKYIKGQLSVQETRDEADSALEFRPAGRVGDTYLIEPLDLMLTSFGVFVAIRVTNSDPNYRIRLNWVRSERDKSRIFLVDSAGEYHYPIASTLTGEVVEGAPKVGIIAFRAMSAPCRSLTMHISGAKMGERSKSETPFTFEIDSPSLPVRIQRALDMPSPVEHARWSVMEMRNKAAREIEAACLANQPKSGCFAMLFVSFGIALMVGRIAWRAAL